MRFGSRLRVSKKTSRTLTAPQHGLVKLLRQVGGANDKNAVLGAGAHAVHADLRVSTQHQPTCEPTSSSVLMRRMPSFSPMPRLVSTESICVPEHVRRRHRPTSSMNMMEGCSSLAMANSACTIFSLCG